MGLSPTRRRTLLSEAERDGFIAADQSEIIAHLPDGWTIRRLRTCGDARREGLLMDNCMCERAGDQWYRSRDIDDLDDCPHLAQSVVRTPLIARGGAWVRSSIEDDEMIPVWSGSLRDMPESERPCSLRDPHNIPHVTFNWTGDIDDPPNHILGRCNDDLKVELRERLNHWGRASGLLAPARELRFGTGRSRALAGT